MFCHERAPVLPGKYHLPDNWLGPLTTFAKSCCQVSNIVMVHLMQVLPTFKGRTEHKGTGCSSLGVVFPKSLCVGGFVPSVVVFTFKRWSLMGGESVIGGLMWF